MRILADLDDHTVAYIDPDDLSLHVRPTGHDPIALQVRDYCQRQGMTPGACNGRTHYLLELDMFHVDYLRMLASLGATIIFHDVEGWWCEKGVPLRQTARTWAACNGISGRIAAQTPNGLWEILMVLRPGERFNAGP